MKLVAFSEAGCYCFRTNHHAAAWFLNHSKKLSLFSYRAEKTSCCHRRVSARDPGFLSFHSLMSTTHSIAKTPGKDGQ